MLPTAVIYHSKLGCLLLLVTSPFLLTRQVKKWAWPEVANTLAYYDKELILVVKSFIVQAPVDSILPE